MYVDLINLTFPKLSSITVYVFPSLVVKAVLVSDPLVRPLPYSNVYVDAVANVAGVTLN